MGVKESFQFGKNQILEKGRENRKVNRDQHLKEIAENSLSTFEEISKRAEDYLANSSNQGSRAGVLASVNTFTDSGTVKKLDAQFAAQRDSVVALVREPTILRLVAQDDDGHENTYFICRGSALSLSLPNVASYKSPIGSLASVPVGDESNVVIANQAKTFSIVERTGFHPEKTESGWDSIPSHFDHYDLGPLTIQSLRRLLGKDESQTGEAELDALLAGESEGISTGISHQVLSAMSLRDQPILDKFQDEIFRLPIDSQLIILGPPGTGKTTTLIKRLGQKLNKEFLLEQEQPAAIDDPNGLPHEKSWLMFTPTELLKHYLKEAFSIEQVPASSDRVQTWISFRDYLARNVLNILQSSTSRNRFVYKTALSHLTIEDECDPRQWFDALRLFHRERMLGQLKAGIELLTIVNSEEDNALVEDIKVIVDGASSGDLVKCYAQLLSVQDELISRIKAHKKEADERIRKHLVLEFNKNKRFLHELSEFLKTLKEDEELDDDALFDDEQDDDTSAVPASDIQLAQRAYTQVIRSISRYKYRKRSVPKSSRAGLVKNWLGDRVPDDGSLAEMGQRIVTQNGLRRFVNPSRRYVSEAPASFREFRKASFKEKRYFSSFPENVRHISSPELDAIVLLMLRAAREILSNNYFSRRLDDASLNWLQPISSQFKNQVLVDEVTDFSALQIGAMANLTRLKSKSFFACGDFNQRITNEGVRSLDQVEWACDGITDSAITAVYRQSQKLNEFSKGLLQQTGGDFSTVGEIPNNINHPGLDPVLAENTNERDETASWLFDRIKEVEQSVQQMPTIAVLVNSEDEVKPMAEALGQYLEEISLKAIPCLEGQALGEGSDVRVFDVRHIKGLEFEAVFFAGIDQLAELLPELFNKYLYVGATRAATFFGVTCERNLPEKLEGLRDRFVPNWSAN